MSTIYSKTCYPLSLTYGLVFCLLVSLATVVYADNPSQPNTITVAKEKPRDQKLSKSSASVNKDRKPAISVSPKREKQVIAFAKSHHPELANLIQRLKKRKPREYKRAIRELDTTLTKLERFKKRDGERYRLTLERWEVDSRIRLLAARVSVMGNSEDKSELKSLIKQRVDLQLEFLRHDHKMAENRTKKLEKSISDLEQNQESIVNAELKKVQRSIKKTGQTDKKKTNK